MLTYQDALDYLYSFVDYSAARLDKYSAEAFDLSRMAALMERLGQPQNRYPSVHLAGTKGKGSVAAMLASIFRAAGYRTGFYTSPHLQDFRERMQVNGELIAPESVAAIVEKLRSAAVQVPGITTFELTTALAFEHFARERVDVAVIEVGLGGRLDATNVVTPLASVITSLSYDHTNLLGDTLAQIAGEKAGIIKPGVPVVVAPQKDEALVVLEQIALQRGAPLTRVDRAWRYRGTGHSLEQQSFELWSAEEERQLNALSAQGRPVEWRPTRFDLPLLGQHQIENAAVACATAAVVCERGLPVSADALRHGLSRVRWPGRFEILQRRPFVVVDGAHNADSAQKLAAALGDYFPGRRVILIFGASSDKDIAGMFRELLPHVAQVIVAQAVHPRALEPEELARLARPYPPVVESHTQVGGALERALQLASAEDVILACGSLFIVAEVRAAHQTRIPNVR